MPALLLLDEAQRPCVSSFEVLNHVLRPTGTDQPVGHRRSCPANGRWGPPALRMAYGSSFRYQTNTNSTAGVPSPTQQASEPAGPSYSEGGRLI
jgi:hypothetical protein